MKPAVNGRHWAGADEVTFLTGMKLLYWICRLFGRWPFRCVLYPVLLWYVLTNPTARRASHSYLQKVAQFVPLNTGLGTVLRHFAAFAETMLDKMLLWNGQYDTSGITIFGAPQMEQLIQEQRGAVLICSHLGNLDLCRVLSQEHKKLRLTVLVHTKHAQRFNQLLAKINPSSQLNLLQVTEMTPATAIILAQKVAAGEFIVIAGDRIPVAPHPRVVLANFLGQPAAFPIGPYVLGAILQCPLYMLFSQRRDAQHSEIHFELLSESFSLPRKGRDQALAELAADYASRLEAHCLSAPLEWFNFYDYWHLPELEHTDATS